MSQQQQCDLCGKYILAVLHDEEDELCNECFEKKWGPEYDKE